MTLAQVEQPDRVVPHRASTCPHCQAALSDAPVVRRERRQVVDLPPTRPQVTEHQVLRACCPNWQSLSAGVFPAEVTQPVQYGPSVKALAVYLQTYTCPRFRQAKSCGAGASQHLPFERTQDYFRDVHHLSLSEGTLASAQAFCRIRGSLRRVHHA